MLRILGQLHRTLRVLLLGLCLSATVQAQQVQSPPLSSASGSAAAVGAGPIRLVQPISPDAERREPSVAPPPASPPGPAPGPAIVTTTVQEPPGEFERFSGLQRFGARLVDDLSIGATEHSPSIPPEYVVQIGDEVQVVIWGAVDADLRLVVDRSGRIVIPRVGPVLVAGVRYGDLQALLTTRVSQSFRNFELSVALGRLRGLRVYVTGFVSRPGAYVVPALSTVMNTLMRAGGPAAAGTFRNIELRRGGQLVTRLDLYDLLVNGDSGGDRLVQPDDVIHVPSVGPQVALRGSVHREAVFELKPGERLSDLLRMGGGLSVVADRERIALERLENRRDQRIVQLPLPQSLDMPLSNGDDIRVFSAVDA
ncbi:MAG: SLBB domain-containing protein, partial [Rubrivivax sp.]|nr:SLBB domain-containing protein [Rubrivivax sp.]